MKRQIKIKCECGNENVKYFEKHYHEFVILPDGTLVQKDETWVDDSAGVLECPECDNTFEGINVDSLEELIEDTAVSNAGFTIEYE